MPPSHYDVAIIGGGAAGLTAGMYACRAGLNAIVLESLMPGGIVANAEVIENFPGRPEGISGAEFGPLLYDQAAAQGLELEMTEVSGLRAEDGLWELDTYGASVKATAVIVAGGSTFRRLGVPGEVELHGAGVSYCATCDGAFFTDRVVGVVGGGDSALDEAMVLAEFASKVIVFHRRDAFRGQKILQDRVLAAPAIEVRWNTKVETILGDHEVVAVNTRDTITGETSRVDLSGMFIHVGLEPNSGYLAGLVELDAGGHILTDMWMRTALPGLLAAGDIRQHSAAQLVSAAGDEATAAIAAQRYVQTGAWTG